MKIFEKYYIKLINSNFWYHVYYKHTKQHKKDLQDTYNRSIKLRQEMIAESIRLFLNK